MIERRTIAGCAAVAAWLCLSASSCNTRTTSSSNPTNPASPKGTTTELIAPGTVWENANHRSMEFAVSATATLTGSFEPHPETCNSWIGPPSKVPCPSDPHDVVVVDTDNYALLTQSRSYTYPAGCDTGSGNSGILTTSCVLTPGNYYVVVVSGKYGAIDWPNGLLLTTTGR